MATPDPPQPADAPSPRSLTRARVASMVPWAILSPLAGATLVTHGASSSWADLPLLWVYLAAVHMALVAAVAILTWRLDLTREALEKYAAHTLLIASWGAVTYGAVYMARRAFRNEELSALLVTCVVLGVAMALSRLLPLAKSILSATTPRALGALATAALLGLGLIWHNRAGFGQLDVATWALPSILVVGAAISHAIASRWREHDAWRWLERAGIAWAIISIVGFAALEWRSPSVGQKVSLHAPVGRYAASIIHRVTDFDGDGHSSLMGGEDCAPFDASVSPTAAEIIGDGIDNNCVGGDANMMAGVDSPAPVALPRGWPEKMNVVVISIETLRADHVHGLGYDRETTPNIDALIEESIVFDRFYAPSTFTRLSLPALWTTRSPGQIAWDAQPDKKMPRVGSDNPWIPEYFEREGYTTLAIQTNFPAFTKKDSIGFERGFTRYNSSFRVRYKGGTMRGFPSIKQTARALKLLAEFQEKKAPFMLWVHMLEPHFKYEQFPGAPTFGDDDIARYDSEIWGVDAQVGRIVDELERRGMWENTILFITGDHGEEFEEHGKRFHGSNLYEPQVRTLGLLRVPGLKGRRVETPVSFSDIGPTLLNMAGIEQGFDALSGRNMTEALLTERTIEPVPIVLEVWNVTSRGRYKMALVSGDHKLIVSGKGMKTRELYDLKADPGEEHNLWGEPGYEAIQARLGERADVYLDSSNRAYRTPRPSDAPSPPP